ncbi:hypothetical protein [Rufibacter sp. LB8]|uniref:hypothetical protein n=1 Tax=Rufibacter sp. LB8 TaxID=2777781 RepID=UPI00178C1FE4|nr:hypothetical protein [Rufibacter sp. LB8]
MAKNDLIQGFQGKLIELRKISYSWNLIPGAPTDEFDTLHHKVLSHLYQGADFEKISRVLESDLVVTYGLSMETEDINKMAGDITEWWALQNNGCSRLRT